MRNDCEELSILIKPGYCETLPVGEQDSCFFRRGSNLENVSDCAKAGTMQDTCYTQVAKRLEDKSICDNIQDSLSKEWCLKEFE